MGEKARLQLSKASSNLKEMKQKEKKNDAVRSRAKRAQEMELLKKIELSSAVSIALKQLRSTQRKKIEQEIKKQLVHEKNAVLKMKEEIASEKERNEREQLVMREKFEKEQNLYRKDKESKNRMFDAEMNKETQRK